jgi:glutamate dehydrogenase/leucine dehydrogenase
MDTYSQNVGYLAPGVITGKSIETGGSLGRREATGRGCMITTLELLKVLNKKPEGATVAVQGFGNVGSIGAKLLADKGCKIVAASDVSGALYNENGLDINTLYGLAENRQLLSDYKLQAGDKAISNAELLACKCDILLLAALENQITKDNAANVRASIIIEGANGPTTKEADAILNKMGVTVIPDVLANAGGVTVSYCEWVQNNQSVRWDEAEVNKMLERTMVKAFSEVSAIVKQYNCSWRDGAYISALKRLVTVQKLRGIN